MKVIGRGWTQKYWWDMTRIHRRYQYRYYIAPRVVRWTMGE
jgi:hypothetical protein